MDFRKLILMDGLYSNDNRKGVFGRMLCIFLLKIIREIGRLGYTLISSIEEQHLEPALNLKVHCCSLKFRVLYCYEQKSVVVGAQGQNYHNLTPFVIVEQGLNSDDQASFVVAERGLKCCHQTSLLP
ncbi:hypothetical protein Tco_0881755 [Tanacetum coccineum]